MGRALLFAALGYGYVGAVLAVIAGAILAMGLGRGAWVALGGMGFFVVLALRAGIGRGAGRRVTREELPALFRAIDRARGEGRVNAVRLTHTLDAKVVEQPGFGGGGRTLALGLPLVHALPADELHALLAHELAQASGGNSRSRRLLLRAEAGWRLLAAGFSTSFRSASFLFAPFFRWYTPRLEALARAASREMEGEAVAETEARARALVRLQEWSGRMERVVFRATLERDTPDPAGFARALAELARGAPMGAADELLGDAAPALAAEVGAAWAEEAAPLWRQCRADALRWKDALDGGYVSTGAQWAHARWAARCEPAEAAIPLLRRVAEEEAEARVLLGTLLLREGGPAARDEAVGLLRSEAGRGGSAALAANEALAEFHTRAGAADEARRCHERAAELRRAPEPVALSARDTFQPCPLAPATRASLANALRRYPRVRAAHLVYRNALRPDAPRSRVLALDFGPFWNRLAPGATELCARIREELRASGMVDEVLPLPRLNGVRGQLRALASAQVFRRDGGAPTTSWLVPSQLFIPTIPRVFPVLFLLIGGVWAFTDHAPGSRVPNDWEAGLPGLREEVRQHPENEAARRRLERAETQAYRAKKKLDEAVRRDPDDATALNSLAWWYIVQEQPDESLGLLRKAVRIDPGHAVAHHNLGWALLQMRRFKEAEPHYRAAIRLNPARANAHTEYGWVLMELYRRDEAEREFREAVRLAPSDASTHRSLGVLLRVLGKLPEALASFRESVRLEPRDAFSWSQIALLTHLRGEFRESLAASDAALRIAPEYANDEMFRGIRDASREGHLYARR